MSRIAALASFREIRVLAASHADDDLYPSASCASAASNRRRNSVCAAASFAWISPSATSTSPHAAPSKTAASGAFR